jgi:hypothetical protein
MPYRSKGPYLIVFGGVALLLLAIYIAGNDQAVCVRQGGAIDCRVARSRVLGLVVVERFIVPDVVDAHVLTTTSSRTSTSSSGGRRTTTTSANNTLILTTRKGEEVPTLGGEETRQYASQINALVRNPAETSILLVDSNWPLAGVMVGFGLFMIVFGSKIVRFVNAEAMRARATAD